MLERAGAAEAEGVCDKVLLPSFQTLGPDSVSASQTPVCCQVLRSGNSPQALLLSKKKQRDLRQTAREQFKLLMCLPYMMHAEALWHFPSGRFIFSSLNPKRMNLFPITVTKFKSCSLSLQPRSSVVVPERLHSTETTLCVCCDSVPEFLLQVK